MPFPYLPAVKNPGYGEGHYIHDTVPAEGQAGNYFGCKPRWKVYGKQHGKSVPAFTVIIKGNSL
jgi:hypothetical protein